MDSMKQFSIVTLGCKVNQCESAALSGLLEMAGCQPAGPEAANDLVVINTCTVTGKAAMQSRQAIRRAVRNHPDAVIVVTGCYAQTAPEEIQRIEGVDYIVGHGDKLHIAELVCRAASMPAAPAVVSSDISRQCKFEPFPSVAPDDRTRAFLKIQDGCNAFCTYCIVPYARGRSRSMPADDVKLHLDRLSGMGFREVVLTGIHLGAYGKDLEPRTSLAELTASVDRKRTMPRLRLSSIEPTEVDTDLIDLMAAPRTSLCPHWHIPLQSGDNDILKRMGRPYTREIFSQTITDIHRAIPHAAIGADILVGFPGEDDAAFNRTVALVEELPVAYLHVFPFSPRKGTPAAGLKPRVRESIVKQRCRHLRKLSEEKKARFYHDNVGRVVEVLVESVRSSGARGLSENYLPVVVPGTGQAANAIVRARIERVETDLTVIARAI
jgi:threonylcarbamoyladenosine tRNA methylthiotransferase MtaB